MAQKPFEANRMPSGVRFAFFLFFPDYKFYKSIGEVKEMSSDYRVLYVDDNKDARELAAVYFNYSDSGCVVTSAESADEALLLIEKEQFDAYVFDYCLPDMSGIELCRYIRQFDADTPILFFSGMARSADISEGIGAGADEYLVKPNDLEKLPLTVRRLLDEKSAGCGRESVNEKRVFSRLY